MSNLWLWFENSEERRRFVEQLLDLDPSPKDATEREQQQHYLDSLDAGKTRVAWFRLEKEFYLGQQKPHHHLQPFQFQEYHVWQKGFRRIYTQKSYKLRPGHWLVLKLRHTRAGAAVRDKVLATFPTEHMGTNVPLPERTKAMLNLRALRINIRMIMHPLVAPVEKMQVLREMTFYAEQISRDFPELLTPKDIYIWEDLANYWQRGQNTEKVAFCFQWQARLQPDEIGSWLNLGAYYDQVGEVENSILAYLEGLCIDPHDKYLLDNIAPRMGGQTYLDILSRLGKPPLAGNHLLAATMFMLLGKAEIALQHYQAGCSSVKDDLKLSRCLAGAAEMHRALNEREKAEACIRQIMEIDKPSYYAMGVLLGFLSSKKDQARTEFYINRLLKNNPKCASTLNTLARVMAESGDQRRSHWFAQAARQLETVMPSQ